MTSQDIIHAYRHLYKDALRAVRYAAPARYTIRDHLQRSFRNKPADAFDAVRVERTREFLHGAQKEAGIEHHVLKTLVQYWYWDHSKHMVRPRVLADQSRTAKRPERRFRRIATDHFYHTIDMLEQSMNIYLH